MRNNNNNNNSSEEENLPFEQEYDYQSIVFRNMIIPYLKDDDAYSESDSCSHYKSKCNIIASCCNEMFPCKKCHDLKKDHKLKSDDIKFIMCRNCVTKQQVSNKCIDCHITFGEYYCEECKIYDSNNGMKYHCNKCKKCLVGCTISTFHCDNCNCCLDIYLKNNHNCKLNILSDNCAICREEIMEKPSSMIKCGHIFHTMCLTMLLEDDNRCPICRKKIVL